MLGLVPAVIGVIIGLWLVSLPDRQPNRLARVNPTVYTRPPKQGQQPRGGAGSSDAAPAKLSASLRAELEQTPQWWIDSFHQVLRASGAERVGGEEWELHTFSGPVYTHREEGYVDCPCHNCRRICS
jgi:hypothetical protein